ncbi:MAG: bifunctional [glutamate--ammonia ligase]-adenylyl-L-tyrosine phosphorylase/[glutamate--ammonia-ligase] adenylyltransferase [Proteobacteria bacterium]|nr:bifunctional [glutamate--ammonia ligase]-adenylyl-L-tyrosine phosphorylase/[glutamate--ammonia-ligase] adenylyltransferase [Pseudomonadota bacterium]
MEANQKAAVQRAIEALPAELQAIASRQLERYDTPDSGQLFPEDMIGTLVRMIACSEFAANTLNKEANWFVGQRQLLAERPDVEALAKFALELPTSGQPLDAVKRELRRYRNRYFLHVLWREFAGHAVLKETLRSLSDLADRLLEAAARYAEKEMQDRFGKVRDENGESISIVILGMGKLGGYELNFSSDIDLIFLYPGGADSDGPRSLSAQEYFTRVSRLVVALLEENTADGFVFRVDTRLRPFGDSGPPVISFAALESYLVQHGRGWERYAYVKARIVGIAPRPADAKELYTNLITPFVYRRYLDYGVFESLREMHALIAAEVQRLDLADNIKLGPGGIREIEFIVQSLQLVRGGNQSDLQGQQLQQILPKLVGRRGISADGIAILQAAYEFLRRLENFMQAIRDQQTHGLPVDPVDRARLAEAMQYADWNALQESLDRHRQNVVQQFEKIAFRDQSDEIDVGSKTRYRELWENSTAEAEWVEALEAENLSDTHELAKTIIAFKTATIHVDAIARRRLRQFMPNLLALLKDTNKPQLVVHRTLLIVERVLRRSAYLALLNENSQAMTRLVSLCGRSAYVPEQIARYPVLLDELLDPRIYTERITREGFESELERRLAEAVVDDSEAQIELLAGFQRASQFRIAVADFNGSLPIMRVSDSLTDVAETVLGSALQIAWRDMTELHGEPVVTSGGDTRKAGFGIVGYGKLGGLELSYGSDLDLVFLHDSTGTGQKTNGAQPLDNTMFFTRLVRRLVHFLTAQTGSGMLYQIDTRLRPDGQSGLLVTNIEAFERYQEENAWTWEHQALLRARPVAGSETIARDFERIRTQTLTSGIHENTLRSDVISMRSRMRKQLDKSDDEQFDLKQGTGGIGDIEFLVQYLVLANAAKHRSVIHYSDNIRQLDALAEAACLDGQVALHLQDIYREFRLRVHHLLLDEQPPLVSQQELLDQRRFVANAWATHLDSERA